MRESNLLPSLFVMAYLGHAYMYRPCIWNKAKRFQAGTTGAFTKNVLCELQPW